MTIRRTTTSKTSPAASSGTQRNRNAVRTGAYTVGLLPWESQEEYDKHCAEFVNLYEPVGYVERNLVLDLAANRWQRKRSHLMTAVAMHRHEFGQALVESGAKSWQEVKTFLHQSDTQNKQTLNDITASMVRVIEIGVQLRQKFLDFDEVSKLVHEIADTCANSCKLLEDIDAKLDREHKFFEQYLPERLESITRLENAKDGQFEKLCSRFQVIQEGRLRREALSLNKQQAAAVDKPSDREAAEQDSPSADGGIQSNEPHSDETGQRSGDGGDRPWRQPGPDADLDADDEPSGKDPLAEFVEEGSES
jgi:hypothetical protein